MIRSGNGGCAPAVDIDLSRFKMMPDLPPHRQIAAYLKVLIALGKISVGAPMPDMRALAYRLRTSRAEVRRAYEELAERGFVAVSRGESWVVSDDYSAAKDESLVAEICEQLWDLILQGRQAGLTRAEIRRIFENLMRQS